MDLPPVPLARPGRRVAAALVALLLAWAVYILFNNPNFQWAVVGKYLFSKEILDGVKLTIELTLSAMAIGVTLGVIAALMRLSDNKLLSSAATFYIVAFRGTPALVQLIFWYNLAALFPKITLGIPFFGPDFVSLNANAIITPVVAANLGLGLCEGAYMAEIVRAGIMSVDPGQREAGVALGLTRAQTMRRIILPQALRVIVPPTGNQIIGMLKLSVARERDLGHGIARRRRSHLYADLRDDPAAHRRVALVRHVDEPADARPARHRAAARTQRAGNRNGGGHVVAIACGRTLHRGTGLTPCRR